MSGTFNCQRQDCPRDLGECSLCGMPKPGDDAFMVMNLYKRCKAWKCLPGPGGLMDQDERIMGFLDVIENEVEKWRQKKIEDQRSEMEKQSMLRKN